jgi:hypothetical protein
MTFEHDNSFFYIKIKIKENMKNIIRNWKTTVLGLVVIAFKVASIKAKGWTVDGEDIAAISGGLAAIMAKDSNKTGVAEK